MPAKHRSDPCRSFNFVVELDGVILGGFSEVSGLGANTDPIDYRHGPDAPAIASVASGLRMCGTLTLKRGVANLAALFEWRSSSTTRRRPATIVLFDTSGASVARWRLASVCIHKLVRADLHATTNEVAIEALELGHEGLTIEVAPGPGRN